MHWRARGRANVGPFPYAVGMVNEAKRLLVTDLDNTLWDWFYAWHSSFSAMLDVLVQQSGVDRDTLEAEIRAVHLLRRTTEYSNLLNELPSLVEVSCGVDPMVVFDDAIHALNRVRKERTKLYPDVADSLVELKRRGIRVVAYTESISFWTEWRIKRTGLDGVIDTLYSAPDHDLPEGLSFEQMRTLPPEAYGLRETIQRSTPAGVLKPSPAVLAAIIDSEGFARDEAVYVGDSLMKDVGMAQELGVLDVHARYGESQHLESYELLQRVTHWSDADVAREQALRSGAEVVPTVVLERSFSSILEIFG